MEVLIVISHVWENKHHWNIRSMSCQVNKITVTVEQLLKISNISTDIIELDQSECLSDCAFWTISIPLTAWQVSSNILDIDIGQFLTQNGTSSLHNFSMKRMNS